MYEFVRGPLALIAFIIFLLGIAWQIYRFYSVTRQPQASVHRFPRPRPDQVEAEGAPEEIRKRARREGTVLGMNPTMAIATTVFHIVLVITPVFLLSHNILIELSWGFQPPSLPESLTDILTLVVLGFGAFFLYRRIALPRVRSITTYRDYLIFAVVFAPYLTGFLAYHQLFAYKTMLIIHILAGELMLVCIPFTKLVHMIFFFLNRFSMPGEYSFVRGSRVWT
jgi:nitrate reductase gamma subunit